MSILVIALVALVVFLGIGALLVLAMYFETSRKAFPDRTPSPDKAVRSQRT